jgi:ketosteroid isomerase-like protein
MDGYARSPELVYLSDKRVQGWDDLRERYRRKYQTDQPAALGQLTCSDEEIELLNPDTALVRGRWHLDHPDGKLQGFFTLLFKKRSEGWRILYDHSSGGPVSD